MEAFGALIHGDLPPAGNRIVLQPAPPEQLPEFPDYHPLWLDSGTSALAVALSAIAQQHPEVREPEVVVPAYCCPDLVAAAVFAKFKVVVSDIEASDPTLATAALKAAINERTLAVIAVNFLGVREKLAELKQVLLPYPQIRLIEDNAQWFPDPEEFLSLMGDYVVFSFGRGKPLSLLGGGLLLSRIPTGSFSFSESASTSSSRFKLLAYNLLLKPRFYQLLNRNPLVKLGETRYHALRDVQLMDDWRKRLLPENFIRYTQRSRALESRYDEVTGESANQFTALRSSRRTRLLRYPLLLSNADQRDALLRSLTRAGLGATAMYQKPLPEIDGVKDLVIIRGGYANAADFARRLITLPLHEGVTSSHLERITRYVQSALIRY